MTERWNPVTGAMTPLAEGTQVTAQLGPYGAMLFRTEKIDKPKRSEAELELTDSL